MSPTRFGRWLIACVWTAPFLAPCLGTAGEGGLQPAGTAKARPARVLVAYYSRRGNTEQMAHAVVEGTRRVPGVVTALKKVDEVSKQDLEGADAIILGAPAYYANIPG